jgi:hypothetical protein
MKKPFLLVARRAFAYSFNVSPIHTSYHPVNPAIAEYQEGIGWKGWIESCFFLLLGQR